MQTEARVGERALSSVAIDAGVRKYSTQGHHRSQQKQQQGFQPQPQIGTISHLLAGGLAGAVSKTCTAPLARLTILFQVILWDLGERIAKNCFFKALDCLRRWNQLKNHWLLRFE